MKELILDGKNYTGFSFKKIEENFMNDSSSLCWDRNPAECDCSACPTKETCKFLCDHKNK